MIRKTVSSTDIKSIGYNEETKILEIEFHSEGIYQYSNVPKNVHSALMGASSHGKYFNRVIKNNFSTTKVR